MLLQQKTAITRPSLRSTWPGVRTTGLPRSACKNPSAPRLQRRQTVAVASSKKKVAKAAAEEPSPFFEPLVRSFLLGIGAGAIVETLHVTTQLSGIAMNVGYQQLLEAMPSLLDELAPMFVLDHVAAASSWLIFYMIEALAIVAVLDRYPNDKDSAEQAIKKLTTLPQRMLPMKLQFAKALLGASNRMRPSTAAAGAAATLAPRAPLPTTPSTKDLTTSQFVDTLIAAPPSDVADIPLITDILAAPPAAPPATAIPTPRTAPEAAPRTAPKRAPARERGALKPGQLDPESKAFLTRQKGVNRQKELKERTSFLKNFWYAAAFSHEVTDKPKGVEILGMRIVLFRGEDGKVQCMQDACPHRGAPLSEGWVENVEGHNCVVCPYHGWAFDGHGKLRDVPSLEEPKWPKRQLVPTFPVEEKGGFIWLFYGSKDLPVDERPPIPYCEELEDPSWQPVFGELEFECGHWAVFENAIDMAHIHYLHGDTFGNKDNPKLHDMAVERDAYGITANFRIHNSVVSPIWDWTRVESVPVVARAWLPSTSYVKIQLGAGVSMITFVNTVPISATRSVNRFCLIRNFAGWDGLDKWAENAMYRILGEDKVMVEKLRPELVNAEVSLAVDLPQIAFRKLRQEYIDMGYGVDPTPAGEVPDHSELADM